MADRKLVAMFPSANKPLDAAEAHSFTCAAKEKYGEIPTFFGLPVYQNPVGIEIEVENWNGCPIPPFFWQTAEDGSLKQSGMELVSLPLRGRNIDYALHELELIAKKNEFKFSHRTSVHVHCNVSTYTLRQLRSLVALYACAEELFFDFVDERRRGNTFCYRLVGTPAEMVFYTSDKEGDVCTKYCAFNIQPVRRQLTVEFRHLEGTQDLKRLRRWIQLCGKLVGYAAELPPKSCVETVIENLTSGTLPRMYQDIWGDTAEAIFTPEQITRSVNNGALWAMALLTKE